MLKVTWAGPNGVRVHVVEDEKSTETMCGHELKGAVKVVQSWRHMPYIHCQEMTFLTMGVSDNNATGGEE